MSKKKLTKEQQDIYNLWRPIYECTCGWEGRCPPKGWATWGFGRTVLRERIPICPECMKKCVYEQVYEKGKHPCKIYDRVFKDLKEDLRKCFKEVLGDSHG